MITGGNAYMPEGEFESNECHGCEGCDGISQTTPDPQRGQTMAGLGDQQEDRLKTTNRVLGLIAGRLSQVAEVVQISVREAEVRHDDWQETIKVVSEVMAKHQKVGAIVGCILVVLVSTLTSVIVGLIM